MKKLLMLLIAAFTSITVLASAPVISFSVSGVTCNGQRNGSITVNTIAGCSGGPFSFTLDGVQPPITTLPHKFGGLPAGAHTLTVSDANIACTFSEQIFVPEPDPITGQFVINNATCATAINGSITLTAASGGTPGAGTPLNPTYTYTVDGGKVTPLDTAVTGLPAGPHLVVITDGAGCTSQSQQLFIPSSVVNIIGQFTILNATCNGLANGSITLVSATGGTPGTPPNPTYTYTVDGGAPVAVGTRVSGLAAGPHIVTIIDSAGCTSASQQLITQPAPITGQFTVTNTTCNGVATGQIKLISASGGTPGIAPNPTYTFSVDGGAATPIGTAVARTYCRATFCHYYRWSRMYISSTTDLC